MDQVDAPRLRPGVRGAFDEETCRMRLHEIGDEIVPRYPFAYGIQEIYGTLLGEYGRDEVADVISVLHELLEDDSYEGYIWRSWRHGWRHRNDDILNPFVPAVGDFVLPPPTSKCIRTLRGANFSAAEGDNLPPFRRSPPRHDENRPSYISCDTLSHSPGRLDRSVSTCSVVKHEPLQEVTQNRNQLSIIASERQVNQTARGDLNEEVFHTPRDIPSPEQTEESLSNISSCKHNDAEQSCDQCNSTVQAGQTACVCKDDDSDKDSQQEFGSVTNSVDQLGHPNLLRFEMLTMRPGHLPHHRRSQSDPTGIVVLRPVHSAGYTDIGRDVEIPHRFSSEYLERNDEYYEEDWDECVASTSEKQRLDVGRCQEMPVASSAVLQKPFSGPMSDAEFNDKPFDEFEVLTAPSTRHQETIDNDETQQFLPDRAYGDEAPRMSLSAVKSYTVEETTPSISTVSDHASLHSWRPDGLDALGANHHETNVVNREVLSLAPREPVSPTPGRFPIDSPTEKEVSQVKPHNCKGNQHGNSVICSRISSERYPIDGHEGSLDSRRTSMLAGRKETQPGQLIQRGRSLLQHMPKVFGKHRESKQTKQQGPHFGDGASSMTGGVFRRKSSKAGWCLTAGSDSPPRLGPNRTTPAYSFDGACDEDDTWSTMPAVDLNKALPPQPLLTKKTPTSFGTNTPSLTHSPDSKTRPSTTSTQSSQLSRVSSKKRFHRTANELVHPDMAVSREPSPLRQLDSDRLLVASKYDPLASPKQPDTPMTFSSFHNANPFMDQYDEFIPPMPVPAIPELKSPDPVKVSRGHGIPQSRSEGQIYSPKPLQVQHNRSHCRLGQSDGTNDHSIAHSRGRVPSRDISQATETLPSAKEEAATPRTESRKRSRSPVKRFLGLGKSQSMKEIPQEKEPPHEDDKKAGLKLWGDRLRHGFMTNTESKANINSPQPEISRSRAPSQSTFPVSIAPLRQARIQAEVELMICISANKFLKAQQKAGLMSAESVAKIVSQWSHKNRPQVVEFHFDQATQRDLILYNINTFKFHGEARTNPMVLNATMYAWKVMAKEMSVRTFCTPDSVMRKHLHDTHKVLEMLGTGLPTFLALQELQVTALKEMADKQKERVERQKQREKEKKASGSGHGTGSAKTRKFTPPTPTTSSFMSAPMSAFMDEDTLFEDPYEG